MRQLLTELRRREVFRTMGFYVVGAWLLLQVGDVIAEPAGLPAWSLTLLLYGLVIGFPVSIFLGWRYDITLDGISRTAPAGGGEVADLSLKPVDYLVFIAILAITAAALYRFTPSVEELAGRTPDRPAARDRSPNSIAVLPFADLSPDQSKHYLADGVADTVIHVLSQVDGVTVTSRTSAFAFRDRSVGAREIGEALNVVHILEGSVQAAGDSLRIIARLVDTRDDTEVWSGNFRKQLSDIFAIQDEIASEVAAAMQVTVLEPVETITEDRYRPDLAAFEKVILGRAEQEKGTQAGWLAARRLFEEATEIDPAYAEAWVALANTYRLSSFTANIPPQETVRIRRPLIEKALDLDPLSAAAHTALGYVQRLEGKQAESTRSFERAIELNGSYAPAWSGLGSNQFRAGEFDASLDSHKRSVELDPRDNQYRVFLANAYWTLAQSERALGLIRDNIERRPELSSNYMQMSHWLLQLGRAGEALGYAEKALSLDPDNAMAKRTVCDGYATLLMEDEEARCSEEYLASNPRDPMAILSRLHEEGRHEEALEQADAMIAALPGPQFLRQVRVSILVDLERWQVALDSLATVSPGLFENPPRIDKWNIWMSTYAVHALVATGQREAAQSIAYEGMDFLSRQRRLQGGGHVLGAEDASYYASLGQRSAMLEALESAIDAGWTRLAMSTLEGPIFDAYRDDDAFIDLVDKLKSNMARQREIYLAERDA